MLDPVDPPPTTATSVRKASTLHGGIDAALVRVEEGGGFPDGRSLVHYRPIALIIAIGWSFCQMFLPMSTPMAPCWSAS